MITTLALIGGTALLARRARAQKRRDKDVALLLETLVADEPTPERFYQVQADDTPMHVALTALGERATVADGVEYLRCISSGPKWNMPLYSTPSTSKQYPDAYMVPGIRAGVRTAFLPRNQDALDLLLQGKHPKSNVNSKGVAIGPHKAYGLLWLPPIDEFFSCADFEWEDGSSAIDPPPELFEAIHEEVE